MKQQWDFCSYLSQSQSSFPLKTTHMLNPWNQILTPCSLSVSDHTCARLKGHQNFPSVARNPAGWRRGGGQRCEWGWCRWGPGSHRYCDSFIASSLRPSTVDIPDILGLHRLHSSTARPLHRPLHRPPRAFGKNPGEKKTGFLSRLQRIKSLHLASQLIKIWYLSALIRGNITGLKGSTHLIHSSEILK